MTDDIHFFVEKMGFFNPKIRNLLLDCDQYISNGVNYISQSHMTKL